MDRAHDVLKPHPDSRGAGNRGAVARESSKQAKKSGPDETRVRQEQERTNSPGAARQVSENKSEAQPAGESSLTRPPLRQAGVCPNRAAVEDASGWRAATSSALSVIGSAIQARLMPGWAARLAACTRRCGPICTGRRSVSSRQALLSYWPSVRRRLAAASRSRSMAAGSASSCRLRQTSSAWDSGAMPPTGWSRSRLVGKP